MLSFAMEHDFDKQNESSHVFLILERKGAKSNDVFDDSIPRSSYTIELIISGENGEKIPKKFGSQKILLSTCSIRLPK